MSEHEDSRLLSTAAHCQHQDEKPTMQNLKQNPRNHENDNLPATAPKHLSLVTKSDFNITEEELVTSEVEDDMILLPIRNASAHEQKKSFCSRNKVVLGAAIILVVVAAVATGLMVSIANKSSTLAGARCHMMIAPRHGKVICDDTTAVTGASCYFTCNDGFKMFGFNSTVCIGNKWTNQKPSCEVGCELPKVTNGTWNCSNQTFENSTCSLSCQNNHHIQGNSTVWCLKDGMWSSHPPLCTCPKCRTGESCEHSLNWQTISDQLHPMEIYGTITVKYAGYDLDCSNRLRTVIPQFSYYGVCLEKISGTKIKCESSFRSPRGAAKAAAAEAIRQMVSKNLVREPCDAEKMDTRC